MPLSSGDEKSWKDVGGGGGGGGGGLGYGVSQILQGQ